jgi:hypothetical protein
MCWVARGKRLHQLILQLFVLVKFATFSSHFNNLGGVQIVFQIDVIREDAV